MLTAEETTEEQTAETEPRIITFNFGCVAKSAIPARLCETSEQREDLLNGTGLYAHMREAHHFTETEIFAYLRLGVSTQSAVAFKALGYETPESLTESPEVAKLLPDHLARPDREYPVEYIDRCEREGVSATDCQSALRRGITTAHLNGVLNTEQITGVFLRNVQRQGLAIAGHQKNIIDYFVDGTIPLDLQDESPMAPEKIVNVVRTFLKEDPDYFADLRNNVPLFRKFLRANLGNRNSVISLRDLVNQYGENVLDLYDPLVCNSMLHKDDGSSRRLGYEGALYIEKVVTAAYGEHSLWRVKIHKSKLRIGMEAYPVGDFVKLMEAGVEPSDVYKYVIEERISPETLLAAKEDGIQQPLMGGAL